MDILKYAAKCGRKESGFENLKTRFQDCNLSGKQENKPDGMIERKQAFNRERKQSAKKASCLCGMNENKEADKDTRKQDNKTKVSPSFLLERLNESKPSGNLHGWKTIKMYHNKSVLQ